MSNIQYTELTIQQMSAYSKEVKLEFIRKSLTSGTSFISSHSWHILSSSATWH